MAKRFTDTTKWKRPWFRQLNTQAKLMWTYLLDECDHAGIFIADFDLITFQLGFKVDETKLREWVGDKLVKVSDDKYFIPSFFDFQYGNSDSGFRAKQGALKLLAKYGLLEDSGNSLKDLTKSYLSLIETQGTGISTSTSKGKEGCGEIPIELRPTAADYEDVYQQYPHKVGKSGGITKLKKLCPTFQTLNEFQIAMLAYVADCKAQDRFLKQFDTFVNSPFRDWLDPTAGGTNAAGASGYDWADITKGAG